MNANPLISIIIPAYNVDGYLKACVDSVLRQTYKDIEIILVDDGSIDKTGKICDNYASKYINVYVYHQNNNGAAEARNLGIKKSKGKYIMFVDSDDWVDEDIVLFLYNNLIKENADISICNRYENYINKEMKMWSDLPEYLVMSSEEAFVYINKKNGLKPGPVCKLIKKDLFNNIRFIGKCQEDFRVTYQLFDAADKLVFSNVPKYHYRKRKSSVTHDGRPVDNEWWKATEIMLDIVEKKYPKARKISIRNGFSTLCAIYNNHFFSIDDNVQLCKEFTKVKEYVKKYNIELKECGLKKKEMIAYYILCLAPWLYSHVLKIYFPFRKMQRESVDKLYD